MIDRMRGMTSRKWALTLGLIGVLVAVVSSFIPSRRTSKLDPIEVIQGG